MISRFLTDLRGKFDRVSLGEKQSFLGKEVGYLKGIKQTSIVIFLTILLTSLPACQSVKDLPTEGPVTETGTTLTAQDKPTTAIPDQSQILESTVSDSSQIASATLENNETTGQSSSVSQKPAASTTQTVPQTTSKPQLTTTQSQSTTTIPTTVQTTTTQPAATTKPTFASEQWIAEILRLTNSARTGQGLNPFSTTNSQLAQAAALRANELTSTYSHNRPDGSECFTVLDEYNISWSSAAENIAQASADYYTPQDIVDGWMNSPGHRANILNSDLTSIAIGYAKANGKEYFVQLFIG